jgi:LmbE family N-acetylglucosaminyl deacetylase
MTFYFIDIINFILLFLLMDFFNGLHNNVLGRKFKNSIPVIALFLVVDFLVCVITSFSLVTKAALLVLEILMILSVIVIKTNINNLMQYTDMEAGKEELFNNRKVMIIVPHEDDDINLAGGVIEEYIKYGSEVFVVFATNGDGDPNSDMSTIGAVRMKETVCALGILGVPEKSIVFLGYGDGWDVNGPHIYNTEPDKVIQSAFGRTATYGLDTHPAYHENNSYTFSNYYDDIKRVILDYSPDIIYCIDYDTHNDHRALSMTFEKVMGEVLKNTDYQPAVYKGYGYRTAWGAPRDYEERINLLSTVCFRKDRDVELYDWKKRIRLPIDNRMMFRNVRLTNLYAALSAYSSQRAYKMAESVINGDKVFWERRTDSLLYHAEISVSSGDKDKLTDFMLLDCDDLIHNGDHPYDGVCRPDADDPDKMISVTFDKPTYVDHIALYDSPSPVDNIINAVVVLDDGTEVETGTLHPGGTSVDIQKTIRRFIIKIDSYEGERFGLTEVEAFAAPDGKTPHFYKLTDDSDNFAYDYIVPQNGEQIFKIYSSTGKTDEGLTVKIDNKKCIAQMENGEIFVKCPVGQKGIVSLWLKDESICDRILVRNPRRMERLLFEYCKGINIHKTYVHRVYRKLTKRPEG